MDDEKTAEFEKLLMSNNGSLLLDEKEQVQHLFLTSYPRSSNSYTRSICDQITGISTGSTMHNRFEHDISLMVQGSKGEAVYDNRAWVLKSHHPFKLGFPLSHEHSIVGNKAVVIVRNPLDSIIS